MQKKIKHKEKKIAAGLLCGLYVLNLLYAACPLSRPGQKHHTAHILQPVRPEDTVSQVHAAEPVDAVSTALDLTLDMMICFIAVGNEVQTPLSDTTMPFWADEYLYIPVSVFNERSCKTLGISIYSSTSQVILYRQGRSLIYERDDPLCRDSEGQTYFPGLRARNGNLFIPAYQAAEYFGFLYEFTPVQGKIPPAFQGFFVWLHQPGNKLDVPDFAQAAAFNMQMLWEEYLRGKRQEPETERPMIGESAGVTLPSRDRDDARSPSEKTEVSPGTAPDADPQNPAGNVPGSPVNTADGPDHTGTGSYGAGVHTSPAPAGENDSPENNHSENNNVTKTVCLCFQADEYTGELLDTLEETGETAAIFCSSEFLSRHGDIVRRLALSGSSIGLIADGESELPVQEQIRQSNQILFQVSSIKTRLVYIRNGSEIQILDAQEAGYACLIPDQYWDSYLLRDASDADTLLGSLSGNEDNSKNITVWMGESGNIRKTRALLSAAQRIGHTLSAFREGVR